MKVILNDVLYDLYQEYCRLKGYPQPTTALEQWIDENSGIQEKNMKEFAEWLRDVILPTVPADAVQLPNTNSERSEA